MKLLEATTLPQSGLRLKNRLVMAPMPTFGAEPDGSVGAAELAYYRRRAEGGVAAIVTAGCAVSDDGIAHPGQWRCDDDRFVESLARCAQAIRKGGARAILQLEHAGGAAFLRPSEASRLLQCFGAAAGRARQAGFEGVALHGGHGELLQQYFSAATNASRWRYGGSATEERSRFPCEAVAAVCEAFGGPCWYRLPPEEPGGIVLEQTLELAATLASAGAEVLDLGVKRYDAALAERLAGLPAAVMAVGGLETPDQAERALADGCALIGLGRALLSEPDWAKKVAAGEAGLLDLSRSDHTKLVALDVPPTVIEYLRRRAAQRP